MIVGKPVISKEFESLVEKQPWEMSVDDYVKESDELYGKGTKEADEAVKEYHRQSVEYAIAVKKPVPPEVLADYPDLQKHPSAKLSNTNQSIK